MRQYKFDTHVHTSETSSCGMVDGASLTHLYKEAGYQGVVITDHYYKGYFESIQIDNWDIKIGKYLQGYRNAFNEGQKIGLNVLFGIELRFVENFNDYLVYGLSEDFLKQNKHLYELGLAGFRELVKGMPVLIYQAHPFRVTVTPADPRYLDGVEVYNGNPRHNSYNDRAMAFAKDNNLKMLSGSDFHQVDDLARGGIVISDIPANSSEFIQLLDENRIARLLHDGT